MGLTEYNKALIKAVASNNLEEAKQYAKCCLYEDKTAKNKLFVNQYQNILKNGGLLNIDVPANISSMLTVEDPNTLINEERYYLTVENKEIYEKIKKMNRVSLKMEELHIPYKNTCLLYGPSGTGKTTFAKYIAYKFNKPFVYINFAHLISSYLGSTAHNIALIFNFIKSLNCVFMLDEIDAIGLERSKSDGSAASEEFNRTTITLMQELDKLTSTSILIAATNRYDRLDEALLRRFNLHSEMLPFSKEDNIKFARKYLKSIDLEKDRDAEALVNRVYSTNKNPAQSEIEKAIIMDVANFLEKNITDAPEESSFIFDTAKATPEITKDKYIFWDIDGTLAPYRFNGHLADPEGTSNGMSINEIYNGVFKDRHPSKHMMRVLNTCHSKENLILGHYQIDTEKLDKERWITKYFPKIKWGSKLLIPETESKADKIISYCTEHDISLDDVIFVDDTLPILQEAERKGITSYHISSFLDW